MSNVRDVDDASYSNRARRDLGAPLPAAERRAWPRIARYASAVLGVLALVAIGYFVWRTYGSDGLAPPQAGRPPVAVVVATATARVWQTQVSAVGMLVAVQCVQVTSEVPGMVSAIHFQSGESVRAGALLLELDAAAD